MFPLESRNSETLSPFFSSTLSVSLSNGGTAGLFWNYIIAAVGLGFVYASIAELSSMYVWLLSVPALC
jgi:amino acid permease